MALFKKCALLASLTLNALVAMQPQYEQQTPMRQHPQSDYAQRLYADQQSQYGYSEKSSQQAETINIWTALSQKDSETVAYILRHFPVLNIDAQNYYGLTPLHIAVYKGHLKTINILLAHGANPCISDKDGIEPLKRILSGATLEQQKNTALHQEIAKILCRPDLAKLPDSTTTYTFNDLCAAVRVDNKDKVATILQSTSMDLNQCNSYEYTPLCYAAFNGYIDTARLLLAHGANPNFAANGTTPLHIAVRKGHLETIKLLLASGANTYTSDSQYKKPLKCILCDATPAEKKNAALRQEISMLLCRPDLATLPDSKTT